MSYMAWGPYVSVAQKRRKAEREVAKLKKKGQSIEPVVIEGKKIAASFWGKAWCDNLERYSDYENRLPRGRSYVRNGSVIDLKLVKGEVLALVQGSSLTKSRSRSSRRPKSAGSRFARIALVRSILWWSFSKGVWPRVSWTASAGKGTGCFRRQGKSSFHAAVRMVPVCASMWRRRSMALGCGSTRSRNFSLRCAVSTKVSCSPERHPAQACRTRVRRMQTYLPMMTWARSSGSKWLMARMPRLPIRLS